MNDSLAKVHTVFVGELDGEPQFGRRLVEALRGMGRFTFTEDRAQADAVLEARGADDEDGFVGDLTLRDPAGGVLWSGHAARPHGSSGPMAYERLLLQLQQALGEPDDHSRTV